MNSLVAALCNGAVAGALTVLMLWIVLRMASRNALNAATRYLIWWFALVLVICLPLLFLRTPEMPAPNPVSITIAAPAVAAIPSPAAAPLRPVSIRQASPHFSFESAPWPRWIFTVWALLSIAMLVRLGISYLMLSRLRSRARTTRVRRWDVAVSDEIATPVAVGPWRPSILIPSSLVSMLSAEEMDQLVLHEAAHLERRDDLALLLQRVIEAVFALHPVVRWMARRIDLEREIACDDAVIAATGNAVSYAECLVRIAELNRGNRMSLAAAGAAEHGSHLSRRVGYLLDRKRHGNPLLLKFRLAAMILLTGLAAWGASRISGVIAFAKPLARAAVRIQPAAMANVTLVPMQAAAPDEISGRVLEDSTGNPLASAELRFHRKGVRELAADLETDRQGRFSAAGLTAGDYTVEAAKPNYVTTTFDYHLPSGSPLIRMVRYGVIDGRATDVLGKPLPGRVLEPGGRTGGSTRVMILVKTTGSEQFQTFREVLVDDDGHYRVYDLPPGQYAAGIWYSGLSGGSGMQMYPDTAHPRFFSVLGGEEYTNINFVVAPQPSWRVAGKVTLPEGVKGQFQMSLGLPDQPALPVGQMVTDAEGNFHFDKIPAGAYDLFASGPVGGYTAFQSILRDSHSVYGRTRVNVTGQNIEDLTVPVAGGHDVKIMLRAAGGQGRPEGCPESTSVRVVSLDPWGVLFMNNQDAAFGKEKTVANLPPGRFRLETGDLGSNCFAVTNPVVDAGVEASEGAIEVAAAGSVNGKLRGGGAFAIVLLNASATDGAQAHLAYPDEAGNFAFTGLRPGRYRIAAQPSAEAARTRWVSARAGQEIQVAGGQPTSVELTGAR